MTIGVYSILIVSERLDLYAALGLCQASSQRLRTIRVYFGFLFCVDSGLMSCEECYHGGFYELWFGVEGGRGVKEEEKAGVPQDAPDLSLSD